MSSLGFPPPPINKATIHRILNHYFWYYVLQMFIDNKDSFVEEVENEKITAAIEAVSLSLTLFVLGGGNSFDLMYYAF